ncbi:MAG TPA: S9 family peptidase [Bacteroidales bacterium]|nr:S9 family peptidase [Bacteroidales bacterium]HRX98469.1 S9 family peptidase [Bacteroidales bacterium]
MRNLLFIFLALAIVSCAPQSGQEKQQTVQKYSIEQFYKNKSVYGGSFNHDESKLLFTSNETGIYNLYSISVDGTETTQITNSTEESYFAISWFPEDDRILYSADQGGNEIDHIYMIDLEGKTTDLTPWDEAKSDFFVWARDEKSFFFSSNKRDPKFFDLYEMDITTFEPVLVYENEEGYNVSAISKDKRWFALTKTITTANNEMYLYDRETGELKHISEHEGDASYSPQFFDIQNKNLYYTTNHNSEFDYVETYNLENGMTSKVWGTNWDVWYIYHSYNAKYRVIGVNEDAKTVVYVFDLKSGDKVDLPSFDDGSISSVNISKSEKLMLLTVAKSTSPSNKYIYNFDTKELTQLTNTLNPEINPDDLVAGQVVRYKSFDALEIPAIYYQPKTASKDDKVPALVWVHGGPGGQSRVSYFALIQYLVNHGYAILAVNNRGSSGYGKTFYKMDDKKHGDVDLQDCIYGKNFLKSTGVVEADKIGIIGGSYGGYMTMAALTFAPEEFACGVNLFGVTNWIRTTRSIPPYWESFKKALYDEMGDPYTEDSIALYKKSPLFHASNVTKPLMVLQGANDPRVLQVESDEIVEAVRSNGVPVEYVLFDDEGHGFVKKENEIDGYGKILQFLNKYLKGESAPPES